MLELNDKTQATFDSLIASINKLEKSVAKLEASVRGSQPEPPKGDLHVVIMGMRGHGQKHIENFAKIADCHIAYLCDVDSKVGNAAAEQVEKLTGHRPKVVQDLREALADPRVDIVSIAAPHHWHALAAIWALQAGKHVYLEKPLSHAYDEGASILAAAKKYGKVVQCGTQLRSNTSLAAAARYMQDGNLGDIDLVHCIVYKPRAAMPNKKAAIPATVDYDLWCGPAELDPPTRGKFHYHWHWDWEFGNGALGNNGIHRIDVARIGLGLEGLGDAVFSFGGRFGEPDSGETPNTQVAVHKFGETWVVQEVYGLKQPAHKTVTNGIIFEGSKGTVIYQAGKASLCDTKGGVVHVFDGKQENHYRNFINAVKKNDPSAAKGDPYEGHISSALCHVANISHRIGQVGTDEEILAALDKMDAPDKVKSFVGRARANLTNNAVDAQMTMGQLLEIDERNLFLGNERAQQLLSRSYREPYVVPAPEDV